MPFLTKKKIDDIFKDCLKNEKNNQPTTCYALKYLLTLKNVEHKKIINDTIESSTIIVSSR